MVYGAEYGRKPYSTGEAPHTVYGHNLYSCNHMRLRWTPLTLGWGSFLGQHQARVSKVRIPRMQVQWILANVKFRVTGAYSDILEWEEGRGHWKFLLEKTDNICVFFIVKLIWIFKDLDCSHLTLESDVCIASPSTPLIPSIVLAMAKWLSTVFGTFGAQTGSLGWRRWYLALGVLSLSLKKLLGNCVELYVYVVLPQLG